MVRERNKKATLEQIRTLFPFDVATLAQQAGVPTDTLYYALLQRPIAQQDAERILRAASQHAQLALSTDTIDVVTWEEYVVLWLIRASKPSAQHEQPTDRYTFLYARDLDHVASLTRHWRESMPEFSLHSFTRCLDGFQIEDTVCAWLSSYRGGREASMTPKIHSLVAVRDDTGSTTDHARRQAATRREEDTLDVRPSLVEQPWIPRRLVQAQPHHFLRWTFLQRKVFALADGKRNTHYIAWMLSTSPKKVTQTLRELQTTGMIARETSHGQ